MNFKCYRVVNKIKEHDNLIYPYVMNEVVIKEFCSFADGYDVFRISVNRDAAKFGVRNAEDNQEKELKDELGEKELTSIQFVIVDCNNGRNFVYFDGNKKDALALLQLVYKINENSVKADVSIEDLVFIQRLRITEKTLGQTQLGENSDYDKGTQEIRNLFTDGTIPEKVTHEFEYSAKEGRKFRRDKLGELLENLKSSKLKKIYIEGQDIHGNILNYDEYFNRKITILDDELYQKWEMRNSIELLKLKNAIKNIEFEKSKGE